MAVAVVRGGGGVGSGTKQREGGQSRGCHLSIARFQYLCSHLNRASCSATQARYSCYKHILMTMIII